MELHRYDIIIAQINYTPSVHVKNNHIQNKKRPYVIVSNESGTTNANIITVMPLTHQIKKQYLPVHECLEVETENGLDVYSMVLGEMPQTICKEEALKKIGTVVNQEQRNLINRVCYNSFFYGEKINWEEVLRGESSRSSQQRKERQNCVGF